MQPFKTALTKASNLDRYHAFLLVAAALFGYLSTNRDVVNALIPSQFQPLMTAIITCASALVGIFMRSPTGE